jgi:hypothetical protein
MPSSASTRKEVALHRKPEIHEVDCDPQTFEDTLTGKKQHDLRKDGDPRFVVGDILRLREIALDGTGLSGRSLDLEITYITSAGNPCALSPDGLTEDYCILSLAPIT